MTADFSRPVKLSSQMIDLLDTEDENGWDSHPGRVVELAHQTAQLLVGSRSSVAAEERLSRLEEFIDREGIDTIAELWARAEPVSLPGALWRLFLMREHILSRIDVLPDVVDMGVSELSTIDPIVLGATEPASGKELLDIVNQILEGTFVGDLPAALGRAAALARVISAGLLSWPEPGDGDTGAVLSALQWEELARSLADCAKRATTGDLH